MKDESNNKCDTLKLIKEGSVLEMKLPCKSCSSVHIVSYKMTDVKIKNADRPNFKDAIKQSKRAGR